MPEFEPLPPIATANISVICPFRNSHPSTSTDIMSWMAGLDSLGRSYELLCIDDGSSDGTGEMLQNLAKQFPVIQVHCHQAPKGLGACIKTGLAAARFPLVAYCDDLHVYSSDSLLKLLAIIDQVHLVSGVRPYRGSLLYRLAVRLFFGVRLSDVDCGLKLFRRHIFIRIPIQSTGSFVHAEILAKANFLGHVMTETPVPFDRGKRLNGLWQDRRVLTREMRTLFQDPDFGAPFIDLVRSE